MVAVVVGSISDRSGTSSRLMMAIFFLLSGSVMMATGDTSAEEPAVVGTHISGGPGTRTLSTPSKLTMSWPPVATIPMPLAQSMGLPPPTATMRSQSSSR